MASLAVSGDLGSHSHKSQSTFALWSSVLRSRTFRPLYQSRLSKKHATDCIVRSERTYGFTAFIDWQQVTTYQNSQNLLYCISPPLLEWASFAATVSVVLARFYILQYVKPDCLAERIPSLVKRQFDAIFCQLRIGDKYEYSRTYSTLRKKVCMTTYFT